MLLGLSWTVLGPLFMLATYTFVFVVVLTPRWSASDDSPAAAALFIFTGLIMHGFFSDCLNFGPNAATAKAAFIKKLVFPIEIVAWEIVAIALFNLFIQLAILVLFVVVFAGLPPATAVLTPLVMLTAVPLCLGLVWFLASLGVFVRDLSELSGIVARAMMFLGPVFYPLTAVPEGLRPWLYANPLTVPLTAARAVLFEGVAPDPMALAIYFAVGCLFAYLGYAWFNRTRHAFADVI